MMMNTRDYILTYYHYHIVPPANAIAFMVYEGMSSSVPFLSYGELARRESAQLAGSMSCTLSFLRRLPISSSFTLILVLARAFALSNSNEPRFGAMDDYLPFPWYMVP